MCSTPLWLVSEQLLTTTHLLSNPFKAGHTNCQGIGSNSKCLYKSPAPSLNTVAQSILDVFWLSDREQVTPDSELILSPTRLFYLN